jgi:hypothetical protein
MDSLPVTFEFDDMRLIGCVSLTDFVKTMPNPQEYFLAPAARWNTESKTWDIIGYGFVHVSHLPTCQQLKERTDNVTG